MQFLVIALVIIGIVVSFRRPGLIAGIWISLTLLVFGVGKLTGSLP